MPGKNKEKHKITFTPNREKETKEELKAMSVTVPTQNQDGKKKKKGFFKKIFGGKKSNKVNAGSEVLPTGEVLYDVDHEKFSDNIQFESTMTLTEMVDMLTGKENELVSNLKENLEMHFKMIDKLNNLE